MGCEQKRIRIADLESFCEKSLIKEGMGEEDARITAEVLAETDTGIVVDDIVFKPRFDDRVQVFVGAVFFVAFQLCIHHIDFFDSIRLIVFDKAVQLFVVHVEDLIVFKRAHALPVFVAPSAL